MIGEGTFGKVYLYGKKVIKSQVKYISFLKEICILKQFNHPNICKIHDFNIGGSLDLILEKGTPLLNHFNRCRKRLSIRKILSDLVSGILHLNSNGIAHCDIKPQNCIIVKGVVKLIDFGIIQFCKSKINGLCYKYGNVYSETFKDPQIDKRLYYHNISSELYALNKLIYHLFDQEYYQGIKRKYYISRKTFANFGIEDDIIDFLMECQKIDSRKTIQELSHHPCLIQSRIHRKEYNCDFWKKNKNNLSQSEIKNALGLMKSSCSNNNIIYRGLELFIRKNSKKNGLIQLKDEISTALFIASQLENDKNTHYIDIKEYKIKEYIKILKGRLYQQNIEKIFKNIIFEDYSSFYQSNENDLINQTFLYIDKIKDYNHYITESIECIIRSRHLMHKFPERIKSKIKILLDFNRDFCQDDELYNLIKV